MSLGLSAVFVLGKAAVGWAITSFTGSDELGAVGGELTDLLGDRVTESVESKRLRRKLEETGDAIAQRIDKAYGQEFRSIGAEQREAVFTIVKDTLARVPAGKEVFNADFNARTLHRRITELTAASLPALSEDEAALYDLVLDMTCGEIVRAVTDLSNLPGLAVPELLRRSTELAESVRTAPGNALAKQADEQHAAFAWRYRAYVVRKFDRIELQTARVSPGHRSYPLAAGYFSLPARTAAATGNLLSMRIEQAFAGKRRIVLHGECGGGKTTWLCRLFTLVALRSLGAELAEWNNALPFYLPLDRFAQGKLPKLEDLIAGVEGSSSAESPIGGEMPQGWINRQLLHHPSIVLINGLDEVPPDRRTEVLAWISSTAEAYTEVVYVLAGRPGAFPHGWAEDAGWDVVELRRLGPADADAFIRRWHEAQQANAVTTTDRQNIDLQCAALIEALRSSHALRQLAGNPLTCALMCAMHLDGTAVLPRRWFDVVTLVLDVFTRERDELRGLADLGALTDHQCLKVLQDLAFWMATEAQPEPTVENARGRVDFCLDGTDGGPHQTIPTPAAASWPAHTHPHVLDLIAARTGVLQITSEHRVRFSPPILGEFLAAQRAVAGLETEFLLSCARDPARAGLLVMAAAQAPQLSVEMWVTRLLDQAEANPEERKRLLLLANACCDAALSLGPELRSRVGTFAQELIPRTLEEADALAGSGPLIVDLLAAQSYDAVNDAVCAIRLAAGIGGEDVLAFLSRFAADDRPEVVAALADAAEQFSASEDFSRLIGRPTL